MWVYEHSIETDVARAAIWRLWADVENWAAWNAEIEKIELRGPFAAGAEISMTPPGQDPVELRVTEAEKDTMFVDEARFDGLVLRTIHRLVPLDHGRTRVVYRMEITGEGADDLGPRIGPDITSDWPVTMAALVGLAARS
ncbi:SRPBCC family protein [Streptomyces sp. SDr-06]|uniref:SRPBCC family protein n=1 Tax=Streptomyces sp. SDr-06 TaxID=2267702 RepID=UPI000DEB5AAF|nr:SRPBCC family protein [Streptomyces sp. SDr-06]RCH69969.1 polyketide cyclase [Streptomyces sp. SDr-06]